MCVNDSAWGVCERESACCRCLSQREHALVPTLKLRLSKSCVSGVCMHVCMCICVSVCVFVTSEQTAGSVSVDF